MLNWRLNVSTNCATFSGIALTVGRKSNGQFNQTNLLYAIVAWAAIAPTGDFLQVHLTDGVQGAEGTALGRLEEPVRARRCWRGSSGRAWWRGADPSNSAPRWGARCGVSFPS